MPAPEPALVATSPWSTYSTSGSTRTAGKRAASSSARAQCVVARFPSSSPAWASANAPEQMLITRAPRACARRRAPRTAGEGASAVGSRPGITTVSARSSASSPSVTSMSYPARVPTGPGRSAHTPKA